MDIFILITVAVVNVKEFNLLDEARANIKVKIDELIKVNNLIINNN